MTAKKTPDETPEFVTVYHPDARLGRSREVPADKLARWQAQGWITKDERDSN